MPGGKDVMPGGAPRGTAARDGEMGLCVAGTAPACTDDSSSTLPRHIVAVQGKGKGSAGLCLTTGGACPRWR